MMNEFEQQMKNKRTSGQKLMSFKPKVGLNERDEAITKWIKSIVKKSMPATCVEDSTMRDFAGRKSPISAKTLRGVLLSLVELVEKKIAEEMKEKRDAFCMMGRLEVVCTTLPFLPATR